MDYILISLLIFSIFISFFTYSKNKKRHEIYKSDMEKLHENLQIFHNELEAKQEELSQKTLSSFQQLFQTYSNSLKEQFIGLSDSLASKLSQNNEELKQENIISLNSYLKHLQISHNESEAKQAELNQKTISTFQQSFQAYSNSSKEQFTGLSNSLANKLSQNNKELKQKITLSLNSYLIQEDKEVEEWTKLVNEETNTTAAIHKLETALNKLPGCLELMKLFADRITPLLLSADSKVQKRAIERYNRAARIFLDNCAPQYWEEAKEMYEDALTLGNLYMKERVQGFEETAERVIRELEEIVEHDILDAEQMNRVEELDKQLSKEVLKSFDKLNTRYHKATQKLFKQITPEADNVVVEDYNFRALEEFKKASNFFNSDMSFYKTGAGLKKLANLLGAWDHNQLNPATQIYFQSVYSDVFSKLEPADKPIMTELILKAEKVSVFA